eukprot:TRINITY_DN7961_c0_g1_i1.p1 TRINITY_DN7961_c0_g1~~TRINITY_DN7961_c0_g1_i1.p1  ORF type:complete len:337 (-),score=56.04 TRINITY_DN7961_c0_g1_i1:48-1058(-)
MSTLSLSVLLCIILLSLNSRCLAIVKGTWLPTYGTADFIGNSSAASQTMNKLAQVGANTVYIDAWHDGSTTYPSSMWQNTTGKTWSGWNYFNVPVAEAKKNGFQVFAWFEYGMMTGGILAQAKPEWIIGSYNGFQWMDPSNPDVQGFIVGIIVDLIKVCPSLDGIQLDDHFAWPEALQVKGYSQNYRQQVMTSLMQKIFYAVKAASSNRVMVSLAPNPIDTSTVDYNVPWNTWLEMGIIEDSIPQIYTPYFSNFQAKFDAQIASVNPPDFARAHMKVGIMCDAGDSETSWDQLSQMMQYEIQQQWAGQVIWYARGILFYYPDQIASIWKSNTKRES